MRLFGLEMSDEAPIELPVEYDQFNSFFADYLQNIAKGGTFIRTSDPLPVGTELLFSMKLPEGSDPLQINGRVQWIVTTEGERQRGEWPGMGIEFIFESEADRVRLDNRVRRLMERSLGPRITDSLLSADPR